VPDDEALARAARVRLMIFDVDGVLTDGTLYYSERGEELKAFNIRDGQGMKMLAGTGVRLAIISGRRSPALAQRAANLGIDLLYEGIEDKLTAFGELTARAGLAPDACGFIGDDLIDLPVLARCGFAASVADGAPEVVARVHYVTRAAGGRGAAREVCELVMRAQGTLSGATSRYLA